MKKLSEYQGEKLQVVQPSFFKRIFELRSDTELLSKLSYPKFFGRNAVTEGNLTGIFEFYFPSFWKSEIEIRPKDYQQPIAKYSGRIFSLTEIIELPKGEKVLLKSFALRQKKEIQSDSGETLVAFNYAISFKFRIDIEIVKKSDLIDKYPWLIMLVIYIADQHKKSKG